MSTLQLACGLTKGHIEIHENSLKDPGVIDTLNQWFLTFQPTRTL